MPELGERLAVFFAQGIKGGWAKYFFGNRSFLLLYSYDYLLLLSFYC
jgi:hypothetical protein